jgi:hypothetical protein
VKLLPCQRRDEPGRRRCHCRAPIRKAGDTLKGLAPHGKFECKNHHICSDSVSLHTRPSQTSRTLFSPELQSSVALHLSAFPNLSEDDVVSSQAKSPDQTKYYFHFSLLSTMSAGFSENPSSVFQ